MSERLTWRRLKRSPDSRPEYSLRFGGLFLLCLFLTDEGWRVSFSDWDHVWMRSKSLRAAKREALRVLVRRSEAQYVRASIVLRAAQFGAIDDC